MIKKNFQSTNFCNQKFKCLNPIFIVGYMHSGTTLAMNILSRHPSIYVPGGETKFFEMLPKIKIDYCTLYRHEILEKYLEFLFDIVTVGYRWNYNKKKLKNGEAIFQEMKKELLVESIGTLDHTIIYRIVFDRITNYFKKIQWIEKTPTHIFHLNEIIQNIPDARFIEIVRDPRDILASKKTRKKSILTIGRYKKNLIPYKKLEKQYDPFWDSLSWKAAIRAGINAKYKHDKSIFTIRYEDLVRYPNITVSKMCDFLRIDFGQDLLIVKNRNKAEFDADLNKELHGIAIDSVGRWKNVLRPEEVAVCQIITKNENAIYGYAHDQVDNKVWIKAVFLLLAAFGDTFFRQIRKFKLYGTTQFFNFIFNYFKRSLHLFYKSK